jgi:hypothetical protein
LLVVADGAYISKGLLHDRPANVQAIGPLCWNLAPLLDELANGHTFDSRDNGGMLRPAARRLKGDRRVLSLVPRTMPIGKDFVQAKTMRVFSEQ